MVLAFRARSQKVAQLLKRDTSHTKLTLMLIAHLGKRLLKSIGLKNLIPAKATITLRAAQLFR